MMNKIRILLLLMTLGVCAVSSVAYADECSEEAKQNARQTAQEAAKESFNNVKQNADAYNTLVKDYLSNCDANVPASSPIGSSEKAVSAAVQAGIKLDDPEIHQYRNISWIGPMTLGCSGTDCALTKKLDCQKKAQEASNALMKLNSSISNTEQQLYQTTNEAMTNCRCNEKGEANCSVVAPSEEIQSEDGKCQINGFLNALADCPLCPIFEVIMKTNADIAHIAWEETAGPLSKVVGTFFLVLLAFEALKAVASVGGTRPSAFLKGVFILCLKISITLGLLSNSYYIYNLFISPVTQGSLEMGLAVAQSSGGSSCAPTQSVGAISSQEISPELYNSVIETARCFSKDAATMPAIGMGLLCISETFSMLVSGLIILFFGIMIWMAFSFYLIDATVQLGMLCALVPLLIACWPFEMTKQYTTKGVRMLMNTFFTFAFAGVLIMLAVSYVTAAITGGGSTSTGDLINAINNNDQRSMELLAAIEGASILTLIACCAFAMKMISHVSGLAGQFSAGSGMSFGAKLGGMATSAATGAAKWGAKQVGKLGGAGIAAIGNHTKAGRAIKSGAKSAMGAIQRGHGALWAGAGTVLSLGKLTKYQNRNAGSATQERGTEAERGREAAPEEKKAQQNQPQPQNSEPEQTPPENNNDTEE